MWVHVGCQWTHSFYKFVHSVCFFQVMSQTIVNIKIMPCWVLPVYVLNQCPLYNISVSYCIFIVFDKSHVKRRRLEKRQQIATAWDALTACMERISLRGTADRNALSERRRLAANVDVLRVRESGAADDGQWEDDIGQPAF